MSKAVIVIMRSTYTCMKEASMLDITGKKAIRKEVVP